MKVVLFLYLFFTQHKLENKNRKHKTEKHLPIVENCFLFLNFEKEKCNPSLVWHLFSVFCFLFSFTPYRSPILKQRKPYSLGVEAYSQSSKRFIASLSLSNTSQIFIKLLVVLFFLLFFFV